MYTMFTNHNHVVKYNYILFLSCCLVMIRVRILSSKIFACYLCERTNFRILSVCPVTCYDDDDYYRICRSRPFVDNRNALLLRFGFGESRNRQNRVGGCVDDCFQRKGGWPECPPNTGYKNRGRDPAGTSVIEYYNTTRIRGNGRAIPIYSCAHDDK
jgi:hypothetical protein